MTQPGPHDGSGATEVHALHEGERAELERLRAAAAARRRRLGWRAPVATVLVVLGCLLAPLAVVGFWAKNEVTNTDRYVENVAPLARDPGVQNLIADRITDLIFNYVDVKQVLDSTVTALEQRGLPEQVGTRVQGLSGAIANGVRGFVRTEVGKVVRSDAFASAWDAANRVAHAQMVSLLSGQGGGAITAQSDTVTVDLGAFLIVLKQKLSGGFTIANQIPDVHPTFTLLQSADVTRAQAGYRTLDRLGTALPFVVLAMLALGVYINRRHRRALVAAGLGLAAAMLVLAIALAIVRSVYLHGIPAGVLPTSTAATVFDTLVRFIKLGLRTLLVLGLVVAAGAFFTGPATTAVRIRGALSSGLARLRAAGQSAGLRTGPVGAWVHANRTLLRAGIVGVAALAFVFWGRPTGKVVIVLALLVLVALAIVEFLATPPRAEPKSA